MKCFYHSADLDGHCSGAAIKYFNPECELIGINYGDEFPWGDVRHNETVYMVDFSLQPFGDMVKLWGSCGLVWIDHHISAIKESETTEYHMSDSIIGLRRDGIGACQLVWEYFTGGPPPLSIALLAQYDVWDHRDERTLPFQYGMRLEDTKPEDSMPLWTWLFESMDKVDAIVQRGRTVLNYVGQSNAKYCSACAFDTELDGLRCIAINKMLTNSQMFESMWDSERYDAMLTFGWRKGKWTVSLYTDKDDIDVSIIAKGRGGGGHKQAAGFQCSELPFELK